MSWVGPFPSVWIRNGFPLATSSSATWWSGKKFYGRMGHIIRIKELPKYPILSRKQMRNKLRAAGVILNTSARSSMPSSIHQPMSSAADVSPSMSQGTVDGSSKSKVHQMMTSFSDVPVGASVVGGVVVGGASGNKVGKHLGPRFIDQLIQSQEDNEKFLMGVLATKQVPFIRGLEKAKELDHFMYGVSSDELKFASSQLIHQLLGSEMSSQAELNRLNKSAMIQEWKAHPYDVGSTEIQIALLTVRIFYMIRHLRLHRHDFPVQRKCVQLIQRRRKCLKYLKDKSLDRTSTHFSIWHRRKRSWPKAQES